MSLPIKKVTDYVVLGAGSAGSVLTNRLSATGASVALVEAGRSDRGRWDSWTVSMPAALTYSVADERYNWNYYTAPQRGLNGRSIHQPRGKILGGSSSINAMVYARGHPLDFERWKNEEGATGWGFADCLPYMKRAQCFSRRGEDIRQNSRSHFQGYDGPLQVTNYPTGKRTNVLFDVLERAGAEAGYPVTTDNNGFAQEGFGPFDMTIDCNTGVRCSASVAYLHPALADPNRKVELFSSTVIRKIIFDKVSGARPRAIGVECEDLNSGEQFEIHANKEVIMSLGAVGSPHVLNLSGIGDADYLNEVGVQEIVHNNAHVGSNLQDHLEVYLQYHCTQPVSLYPVASWSLRHFYKRLAVGVQWFFLGSGVCASNQFESGAFIRSDKGIQHPDIQYHFIPGAVVGQLDFLPHHAFQTHVGTLRPTSRGSVKIASKDHKIAPIVDPNFLNTEKDIQDMRKAVRAADEIIRQPAFDCYRGKRLSPSNTIDLDGSSASDEAIDAWVRDSSHSAYHLSCTCAMGKVVDPEGKVIGVDSLRVVDASITPSMTSGNLNAPTIMIAEKISDLIMGYKPLEPEPEEYFVHENWQTQQR